MEAKYFRDYRHCYLILGCPDEKATESYSCRMLTEGRVEGLLRCAVRHVNGKSCLYYDISSKVALSQFYLNRKMARQQVRELLAQLQGIYAHISVCFMEESWLLLDPEYLYLDMESGSWMGVYHPEGAREENSYRQLLEFLMDHADMEDTGLADRIFQMYEMAEEGHYTLETMLGLLEESGAQEDSVEEKKAFEEPEMQSAGSCPEVRQALQIPEPVIPMPEEEKESSSGESSSAPEKKEKKRTVFYPVFGILALLGCAGAVSVSFFFELSSEEQIVLWGCAGLMGSCVLFCIWQSIRQFAGKGNTRKEEDWKNPLQDMEEVREDLSWYEPVAAGAPAPGEHLTQMKWMDGVQEAAGKEKRKSREDDMTLPQDYGNTVFFERKAEQEYKLYAMDRKNKVHIRLEKFPCTVGKMTGCVDHVLGDDSVSRIHARLEKRGEQVYLTDLNSTNGTYRNGLRMQPQETVEIEPGDEIRFGKLNYCYR